MHIFPMQLIQIVDARNENSFFALDVIRLGVRVQIVLDGGKL
jgi:hypothetical protein